MLPVLHLSLIFIPYFTKVRFQRITGWKASSSSARCGSVALSPLAPLSWIAAANLSPWPLMRTRSRAADAPPPTATQSTPWHGRSATPTAIDAVAMSRSVSAVRALDGCFNAAHGRRDQSRYRPPALLVSQRPRFTRSGAPNQPRVTVVAAASRLGGAWAAL